MFYGLTDNEEHPNAAALGYLLSVFEMCETLEPDAWEGVRRCKTEYDQWAV